jgi:hypothetical protein
MPIDNYGSQIYLYVAGKTYRRWRKSEIPDDIRAASLIDEPMRDLTLLKDWIYRRRSTASPERERHERCQQKEEEVIKRKTEQPALFEF